MTYRPHLLTTMVTIVLLISSRQATASGDGKLTAEREIYSCITEVNSRVNYEDATRVRHFVVEVKSTGLGHVFTINTNVYTTSAEIAVREYNSYCVAKGNSKPVKFRIEEVSG